MTATYLVANLAMRAVCRIAAVAERSGSAAGFPVETREMAGFGFGMDQSWVGSNSAAKNSVGSD